MPDKRPSTIVMEVRPGVDGSEPNARNTLRTNHVRKVLDRLFAAATQEDETPRWRKPGLSWETANAQERADASESAYMPISRQGGELLYIRARAKCPNTIAEFGSKLGRFFPHFVLRSPTGFHSQDSQD